MLSFIHQYVETLSKYFTSFSEYHLVFNLEKCQLVLDEWVENGAIVASSSDHVLPMLARLERQVSLAS
eukprot:jgi/Hompol1/6788/HPOL_002329-RA